MADARVAIRLVLAAVILAGVVLVLGPTRLLDALTHVDPRPFGIAFLAEIAALALWGLSLAALLQPVDGSPRGAGLAGAYCTGLVLRLLVPWGRSGGAVFTAVALSRSGSAPIERLLATSLAADLLRFLVSLVVVMTGAALLSGSTVSARAAPVAAIAVVGVTVIGIAILVVAAPEAVTRAVVTVAATLGRTVGRVSPTVAETLDPDAIADRTHRFFETVHTLTHNRAALVRGTGYAALGWIAAMLPLYFTVQAAGAHASIPAIMVIVPTAGLAGITPLPGGSGSVEVALVGLLVVIANLDMAVAGAVTVLYRLATFWFSLALAGVGAVVLSGQTFPRFQNVD
ncbi:MAG: flippase-like domain-containing protein [Halobacteriaceae archaeon]